jgi:Undecaprenyl-phosphate glucose phosphotransferase
MPRPNSRQTAANGSSGRARATAAAIDGTVRDTAALPTLGGFDLGRTMRFGSPALFAGFVRLAETGLLAALGYIIAAFYVDAEDFRGNTQYMAAPIITALAASALFHQAGLYSMQSLTGAFKCLPRVLLAWTVAIAGLVACVFFLKIGPEFSRVWLALWHVAGCGALIVARASVASSARRALKDGRLVRRAVVYGGGAISERVLRDLAADPASDVRICGVFDDRGDARMTRSVAGYPHLGNSSDLVQFGREKNIDLLIVALPMMAEGRLKCLLAKLGVLPVDIRLAGRASEVRLRPRAYSYIGAVPFLDLHDKPIAGWSNIAKSVFDKTVAALAVIVLSPVMLAVAAAIKLDSKGPVLFRQKRYGFNNELIEILKFRSMYSSETDAAANRLVTKSDPRVTKIGRVLRKSSLDELPQLFNVLAGTLSLVGPRPHAVQAKAANALYPDVVDGYFGRHKVKPGITGWAQINGWRGETDTEEKIQKRVEYDMDYIENWSLAFDLYILARTPFALLNTNNAY